MQENMEESKDIIKKIKTLEKISPSSEWQTLNRAFLIQEIKTDTQVQPTNISFKEYGQVFVRIFGQRVFEPAVVILLMLGVFLGSSLVINAAFYSLPGDSLYRAKIVLEQTQLAITPGEEKKGELKMEFAKKRVEEFDKILAQTNVTSESRQAKLNTVVEEFTKNVVAVKEHINKIDKETQPAERERTLRMAATVSSNTDEMVKALGASNLSAIEKIQVEEVVAEAVAKTNQIVEDSQSKILEETTETGTVKGEAIEVMNDNQVVEGEPTSDQVIEDTIVEINDSEIVEVTEEEEVIE